MVKFRIGHTGITWGYDLAHAEEAARDVAELGYAAYETFGFVLEQYAQQVAGGFGTVLHKYGLAYAASYCPTRFRDPADAGPDIEHVLQWARLTRDLGGTTIVLQATQRQPEPYTQYEEMAAVFNDIGRRASEMGLVTAIHPHTGTLIETEAEIRAVLDASDPHLLFFAPDTGQIVKGGGDVVAILDQYKQRIGHVHLKDYGGGRETGYAGYEPIGSGVIDMAAIFRILEEANFGEWVMVELDGTPQAPRPPREAAAMSKRYLEQLLGDRAAW